MITLALYDWLDYLDGIGEVKTLETSQWNKRSKEIYRYRYRYVNQIPLRDTQPALLVNWCELTLSRQSDGKVLYQNAFITHHELTDETVSEVVVAGRSRWKTENENHNVLKTRGYHLEHNFGHGQNHVASLLLSLNLLAFLFHIVLHLVDKSYQKIRQQRGTCKGFFQDLLSLTKYLLFDSWQHLIDFMLSESVVSLATDSSQILELLLAYKACSSRIRLHQCQDAKAWLKTQETRLKHNQWPQVLAALRPYLEPASVDDKQALVRAAYRYLDNRSDQLDYQGAIAAGLPIGSGEIESAHRYIILERLDIAGA